MIQQVYDEMTKHAGEMTRHIHRRDALRITRCAVVSMIETVFSTLLEMKARVPSLLTTTP